jgi:hypothetical protein
MLWSVLAHHFADKPYRFQDDNAPVHWTRIIEEFKRDNDIHSMTWPAQSSDLNIIEILWLRIKRSLQNAAGNINTPQELFLPFRIFGWTLLWITFRTYIPLFHAGFWQLYGRRVTSQNIKVNCSCLPYVF